MCIHYVSQLYNAHGLRNMCVHHVSRLYNVHIKCMPALYALIKLLQSSGLSQVEVAFASVTSCQKPKTQERLGRLEFQLFRSYKFADYLEERIERKQAGLIPRRWSRSRI